MPTVQEVRSALADAIAVTGLRSAPMWQDTFTAPIAIITRREFDPRLVFTSNRAAFQFTVTIYADRTNERTAQVLLDDYCELSGATSIVAAIQDDANWSSVDIDYVQVIRIGEVTASSQGESNYLAVPIDVEVVF
jgi:hypothetical protein